MPASASVFRAVRWYHGVLARNTPQRLCWQYWLPVQRQLGSKLPFVPARSHLIIRHTPVHWIWY